ncbi:MAG: cysteine desulfurase family protein [Planctomycetota bacterium]
MKPVIYLDNNSTTPIAAEVIEVMTDCYQQGFVNPASQHRPGQIARARLEDDREKIAGYLGAVTQGMETDSLVFTSGGTESNNLAMRGLVAGFTNGKETPGTVVVSAIEHPSVLGTADYLKTLGFKVRTVPVTSDGVLNVTEFLRLIEEEGDIRLACLMLANNETGAVQPVNEFAGICRQHGIATHCDAVQGVGKINVDFRELGVDSISFTAHKFHGPRGIGGLLIRHGTIIDPILFGGFQQMAVRPGTEDVALVAGMAEALRLFKATSVESMNRIESLRNELQINIVDQIPDTVVNSGMAPRVPHTLNLSFPGIDRQAILLAADLAGLAVSTGSACASGSSEPSHVITAMTSDPAIIEGSIRISLGRQTTQQEIEESVSRIINICNSLGRQK